MKRSHTKPRPGNNKPCGHEQHQGQILHRNKGDHKPTPSNRLVQPDSYPSDVSSSEDSFCLKVKIKQQQDDAQKVPRLIHLITNITNQLKQHHTRNQYLRARIDTGAEVNLMPLSVYRLVYHDHDLKRLTPSQSKIGTYTTDTIKILGTIIIYLVHKDSKKLTEMIFYIACNEGSILLSCNPSLTLGLIHSRPRLDYLPPRASLTTSNTDHPRKMKAQIQIQKQEITVHTTNQQQDAQVTTTTVPKLVTSQDQIMHKYLDVLEGIGKFSGPPYHIHVDPSVTPKQTPCRPIPIYLKDSF